MSNFKKEASKITPDLCKILEKASTLFRDAAVMGGGKWYISGGFIPKCLIHVRKPPSLSVKSSTLKAYAIKNDDLFRDADIDFYFSGTRAEFHKNIELLKKQNIVENERSDDKDSEYRQIQSRFKYLELYTMSTKDYQFIPCNKIQLIFLDDNMDKFDIVNSFDFIHVKPIYDTTTGSLYMSELQYDCIINSKLINCRLIRDIGEKRFTKWINKYKYKPSEDIIKHYNKEYIMSKIVVINDIGGGIPSYIVTRNDEKV